MRAREAARTEVARVLVHVAHGDVYDGAAAQRAAGVPHLPPPCAASARARQPSYTCSQLWGELSVPASSPNKIGNWFRSVRHEKPNSLNARPTEPCVE